MKSVVTGGENSLSIPKKGNDDLILLTKEIVIKYEYVSFNVVVIGC